MTPEKPSVIRIKGARQHNLRNLDIEIPRHKLVVVTGPSGSGKSSLAYAFEAAIDGRKVFSGKMTKCHISTKSGQAAEISVQVVGKIRG